MAACSGSHSLIGVGRGKTRMAAVFTAIGHIWIQGQQACAGGTCDSGACKFGLTSVDLEGIDFSQISEDEVQASVDGEGSCFCE